MKREDDQELWDLLGQAAEPSVSPFFARNVLREIRQPDGWAGWHGWFTLRRLIPATGVALALIAVAFLRMQTSVVPSSSFRPEQAVVDRLQDHEVIADLDDLLASDDNNSWEDNFLQ
jgi:hypothetical protein